MAILNFPTLSRNYISSGTFSLMPNTQIFESPLNRSVQTVELPGARWLFSYNFEALESGDIRKLKAFLAQLRGASVRFYMEDKTYLRSGTAAGSPLVKGALQVGSTLITDGWTPSQPLLLDVGDYISINYELKIITQAVASDGSGEAILTFEPPLRVSPEDDAVIVVNSPKAIFRLSGDESDNFNLQPPFVADFTLDGVEMFT
jgi:hypothetical protein